MWRRLAVYLSVAVALTWPLVTDPLGLVVGAPRSDVWNSLWGLWFVEGHGPLPALTHLLDFPSGGRLAVADPLNALLGWPLVHSVGPVGAYAALVLVHLSFAGFAADLLGRASGGRGWVAGIGYQLAPVCISFFHDGSSEAIATGWLPLAAWALIRAVERGGLARSLGAGLALIVVALSGWYAGVGAWIFVGALLLFGWARVPWRARLLRLLPGLVLALGVTLPVARAIRGVALAPDGLVDIKQDDDLARIRRTLGSADPRVFVMPGDFRSPDFSKLEGNPGDFVHTAYLGWILVALALWVTLRRPRDGRSRAWVVALLVGMVLAMGPVVVWGGRPLAIGAREISLPLPYLAIEALPGFSSLSLLYRLAEITALGLAVLADRGRPLWALAIAAEVLLVSPVRHLPAVTPLPQSTALQALADSPLDGAVMNLPPTASRAYLYEQIIHERPMVGSLNAGINRAGLEVARAARKVREGELPAEELHRIAEEQGIRWAVLHRDVLMDETWIEVAGAVRRFGEPLAEDERVRVVRLY